MKGLSNRKVVEMYILLLGQACYSLLQLADQQWPSGYDDWLPIVGSQVRVSAGSPSGLAWSLYKCEALWRAVCDHFATERPLGTVPEENRISSLFQVSISFRYDLSC